VRAAKVAASVAGEIPSAPGAGADVLVCKFGKGAGRLGAVPSGDDSDPLPRLDVEEVEDEYPPDEE